MALTVLNLSSFCVVLNLKLHERKQLPTLFLSGMAIICEWRKRRIEEGWIFGRKNTMLSLLLKLNLSFEKLLLDILECQKTLGNQVMFFRPDPYRVARRIQSAASSAAAQMSGYNCPRILVIACEHPEFSTYLKKSEDVGDGAEIFLTSPPVLALPNLVDVTDLANSLFFRLQNGSIVFLQRKHFSGATIFYISKYHAQTTGLLHPLPARNFSIELFTIGAFCRSASSCN